jgi:DNA-binding MarR family transcriptional regulator
MKNDSPPETTTVVEELLQTRPFPTATEEAAVTLFRTAEVLRRRLDRIVGGRGLTGQQYNVLRILKGCAPEPMPTLEIAERLVEEAPGITRLLDRLEAHGWVTRKRCPEDRRQVHCSITAAGAALLEEVRQPMADAIRDGFGTLAAPEVESLIALLNRTRAGFRAGADATRATPARQRRDEA